MWVERIEVTGFKRLAGIFELDPGLTLIVGPNEAGKSSLGELFVRSVWGFERTERRRREDVSLWERCRPWDGRPWRLVAIVVDHEGRRLRAEWDYAEHTLRLLDAITAEDLTSEVTAPRGDVTLGTYLTGLQFSDFRAVCLFDQHTLAEVRRSDSLVNALQRSVESAEADVGVDTADGRLKDFLRTQIGVRSDTYSPLPAGPLRRDLDQLAVLNERLSAAQQAELELAGLAQQLARRQLQRTVLAADRREIERATLAHDVDEARNVRDEAVRLHEIATASSSVVRAPFDEQLVTRAREGFGAVAETERAIEELERAAAEVASDADELRAEEARLSEEVEELGEVEDVDADAEATAREQLAALREVSDPPCQPPPVPAPDSQLSRYRDMRAELLALAEAPKIRWDATRLAAAVLIALASLGAGVTATPVAFAGILVAAVLVATARSVATGAALHDRLQAEFGVDSLDALDRRAREEDETLAAARAAVAAAQSAAEAARARRAHLEWGLTRTLDAARAPAGALPERAEQFLGICELRAELDNRASRLSDVRRGLSEAEQPKRDLVARRAERAVRRDELSATLSRLGIEATDLAVARDHLDTQVRESRQAAEARAEAAGAVQALDALLAGRTIDDLEEALHRSAKRLAEHERAHPDVPMASGDADALRARLTDTDAKLGDARHDVATLEAQIGEREAALPSVAELREQIAVLEERIEQRELAAEAVRIARAALRSAASEVHRNFAPHLQRALQRTLPRFTSERYRDVAIADDLSIKVVAPETSTFVSADCLSFGTQDQIYLVQRLEIAKLLIPTTGPVPLVLDEPFAEFDEDRERSALQLLAEEAVNRQVVVLTKDRRLVDLVAELGLEPRIIELESPSVDAVAK